jgi:hypothetical protein
MEKHSKKLIGLWVIGILILAAFGATLFELPVMLQNENKFKLFMRIVLLVLMLVYLINRIAHYRKQQNT